MILHRARSRYRRAGPHWPARVSTFA
jgi:hypothetical protein